MIYNKMLNEYEKNWLEKMLSYPLKRKDEIVAQINQASIVREYTGYYLSVKFMEIPPIIDCLESTGVILEMRAYFKKEVPIQFLLHFKRGSVSELEIFKADSSKIQSNINLNGAQIETIVDPRWRK